MRRFERQGALTLLPPVVLPRHRRHDGTGRGMWRGRAGVMAVVGFDLCGLHKFGFTGFGSRLSKVRCGLGSRAGAAKR